MHSIAAYLLSGAVTTLQQHLPSSVIGIINYLVTASLKNLGKPILIGSSAAIHGAHLWYMDYRLQVILQQTHIRLLLIWANILLMVVWLMALFMVIFIIILLEYSCIMKMNMLPSKVHWRFTIMTMAITVLMSPRWTELQR